MSAKGSDDSDEETRVADCGHEVLPSEAVSVPEVILCEECYRPFDVTEWPEQIGKYEHRVIEARGTSKVTHYTTLLGLDRRGRAVYYDSENSRVKTFVPKNDTNYRQDREARRESYDRDRLRPRRKERRLPGAAPPTSPKYVTLPNGDHMVQVESSDKIKERDLQAWLLDNVEDWQQVRPTVVEDHGIEGFGTTSGKPLVDRECDECGHAVEQVDPEDSRRCPECDSHKFYPTNHDEEE